MSTIAKSITQTEADLRNTQPVGPGGILGRLGRMIAMVLTCGFAFPNVWVEGLNPSKTDWENQRGVREADAARKARES